MTVTLTNTQHTRFYSAALLGLRALDATERTARRFGPDPDARWQGFAGHLGLAARIDLLVRDAAVQWGAAFSPAVVFGLPGLAVDEPFGPDWAALPEHDARRLWADAPATTSIADIARALGVEPGDVPLPAMVASTRLLVAGGPAICAVATHFRAHPELSWSDQVLVVAEEPPLRQLAGLMAPLVGAQAATRLVRPGDDTAAILRDVGVTAGGLSVTSPDASPAALAFVRRAQEA